MNLFIKAKLSFKWCMDTRIFSLIFYLKIRFIKCSIRTGFWWNVILTASKIVLSFFTIWYKANVLLVLIQYIVEEKKKELWASRVTKAPIPTENEKRHQKLRLHDDYGPTFRSVWIDCKIEKVPRIFKVKSRVKTRQVQESWPQHLVHRNVSQKSTEPGVQKG